MAQLKPIAWIKDSVRIIDQTRLPTQLVYEDVDSVESMFAAIRELKVRGAPLIGIAAAYGLCVAFAKLPSKATKADFMTLLEKNADYLADSRPTAVNLFWALDRMKRKAQVLIGTHSVAQVKRALLAEAHQIFEEDRAMCRSIGEKGYDLLKGCATVQTHCNAGGLATSGFGTALAPIYVGKEKGKLFHVYVDETRPLLQGARITAFELQAAGIPVTLICDNMAATTMVNRKIDAVIVGADRIAGNGDTANKVGTYGLAIVAKAHHVPFYVAAPSSTFDLSIRSGAQIPIEERGAKEIIDGFGRQTAPSDVQVYNPAFDVTPHGLITAIITEKGVIHAPDEQRVRKAMGK
jgi:methylthioribose-1-phosphate isomerase